LNTSLLIIINSEKYKVIAITVCPLGKLKSFSITKEFNNEGLGIFVIFLIKKVRICPIITFDNKKYANLFCFFFNNQNEKDIVKSADIINPPKTVIEIKMGFRKSTLLE
jgi:hypothetical protein